MKAKVLSVASLSTRKFEEKLNSWFDENRDKEIKMITQHQYVFTIFYCKTCS